MQFKELRFLNECEMSLSLIGLFFEGRLKIEFKESDVSFAIAFFSKERSFPFLS